MKLTEYLEITEGLSIISILEYEDSKDVWPLGYGHSILSDA